jgi:long-chain acyl-CoA synthetase
MVQNLFAQPSTRVFLQTQSKAFTYGWLQDRIKQISGLFHSLGLETGDRIILAVSDSAEFAAVFLAGLINGITLVIVDPQSKAPRVTQILERTQPKGLLADKESLDIWKIPASADRFILSYTLQQARQTGLLTKFLQKTKPEYNPHDYLTALASAVPIPSLPAAVSSELLAYIIFTSGSTTQAKGVAITQGNLSAHLVTLQNVYGLNENSALLNQLLLCHADGCIQGPILAAAVGCTWHHPFRFTMDKIHILLDYCYAHNITHFFAVPAMLNMITQFAEGYEDSFVYPEFKALLCVSAHLDASLWDRFESLFKVPLCNIYGLTETVAGSLFCGPKPDTYRKYTVGKPVDCQIRIIDELGQESTPGSTGELCLSGDHIMKSYWGETHLTQEVLRQDWFHTGDLVSMDSEGYVTIKGRKKNLVISGGINIHPEEVTECLLQFSAIAEACALGLPDEVFGEKLVAAVVLNPGYRSSAADIVAHCREWLEEPKIPTQVFIVQQLPKGVSGKVKLEELKEQLSRITSVPQPVNGHSEHAVLMLAAESFQVPVSRISIKDTSQTVPGWDSLAHLLFITSLEEHFQIKFKTSEIITLNSIQKATELVKQKHG